MFENRLKFIREREGIKQQDLARKLKISKSTYSNYENEHYIIPLKHLINFCNIFNISVDYLFGFNNKVRYSNMKDFDLEKCTQRLKELRQNRKLSQEVLARTMKDHRTNISGYEIGKHLISTTFLYELCKKYNISADYILGRIDN